MTKVTKFPANKRITRSFIAITDFDRLQNPRRPKRPTWLKSYVRDLDSPDYLSLTPAVRGVLGDLIRLAGLYGNRIPNDMVLIARRICTRQSVVTHSVRTLHTLDMLTVFEEDLETSKNNDFERLTDIAPIRPSISTSQSKSSSTTMLNLTTGDEPEIAPDSDDPDAYYEQLAELDADREAGGSHD